VVHIRLQDEAGNAPVLGVAGAVKEAAVEPQPAAPIGADVHAGEVADQREAV
jgi:hypothetical protein